MDQLLNLLTSLSRWSRGYLYEIALTIMATLLVLFGSKLNARLQRSIAPLNFLLRALLFVLVCMALYGLAMIYLTPRLVSALGYFDNYSLAPVLLLILLLLGVLATHN